MELGQEGKSRRNARRRTCARIMAATQENPEQKTKFRSWGAKSESVRKHDIFSGRTTIFLSRNLRARKGPLRLAKPLRQVLFLDPYVRLDGVNPQTLKKIKIAAGSVPRFKASALSSRRYTKPNGDQELKSAMSKWILLVRGCPPPGPFIIKPCSPAWRCKCAPLRQPIFPAVTRSLSLGELVSSLHIFGGTFQSD